MVGAPPVGGYGQHPIPPKYREQSAMTSTPSRRPQPPPAARPREAVGFARKRPGPLYGVKAVGSFVPGLTRKAFEKYGFSTASLVTDWATIVGRGLAASTAPERLKWPRAVERSDDDAGEANKGRPGATLVLRVDGGRSLAGQHSVRPI